jgi:hypothetical protein
MPAELGRHLKDCPGCSALISRLSNQCGVRLPESLTAGIPDMKKQVFAQIGGPGTRSEERSGTFAWPLFWKLALLPLVVMIALAAVYFVTDRTTRVNGQKTLSGKAVATLIRAENLVEKLRAGATKYVNAMPADQLFAGDAIRTGDGASAELVFADSSKVLLGSGAWFKVIDAGRIGEHLRGRAVYDIEKQTAPGSVEVVVPQGITAVLGTKFVQEIGEIRSFIAVSEGVVEFRPDNHERQLLRPGHLLCFDSSGRVTERKEPGSALVVKLYDLSGNVALDAALSSENAGSEGIPKIAPPVEPANMTDSVATSTQKIDESGDENRLASDSVETVPEVDTPAVASDDVSVPHGNASETSEDSILEEPSQPGESGQSSLGVSGF